MAKHWFCISSNGAVALGTYEAGVIAQLYADISEVNVKAKNEVLALDVISGASAGAVGGSVLAQALALRSDPAELTQTLMDIWVTGLSLVTLIGDPENPAWSLFDPGCFTTLAQKVLKSNEQMSAAAPVDSPEIALTLALTNVQGIPYQVPYVNTEEVVSLYADYTAILVEKGLPYLAPPVESLKSKTAGEALTGFHWENEVKEFTITSGAFPMAFSSRTLTRDLSDYPDAIPLSPANPDNANFVYSDGGVLDNNPIGRAIDAAAFMNQRYGHGIKKEERTYIVIEPDPTTAAQAAQNLQQQQKETYPNGMPFFPLGFSLIGAYFNNAMYSDLVQARQTNERLQKMNDTLGALVAANKITDDECSAIMAAAGYDYKEIINLERIPGVGRKSPLAGAFQGHFGGFFAENYRVYDFGVGCFEARQWLSGWLKETFPELEGPTSALQNGDSPADPPTPIVPGGFTGLPAGPFGDTKDLITKRIETLLSKFFDPGFIGTFIEGRIIRHELEKHMVDPPQ